MSVLLIDDEEDMRAIVSMSLSELGGLTVLEAASGPEGVRLAAQEKPALILLDVVMPEMDGLATFQALQEEPSTRDIPVVFLTGSSTDSELTRLLSLGARGVLRKPFDPLTLPSQVRAYLSSRPIH